MSNVIQTSQNVTVKDPIIISRSWLLDKVHKFP